MYEVDDEFIIGQTLYRQLDYDDNGEVSKETLLKSINSEYVNFSEGLCAVVKNKKYGFINKDNEIIISFSFDGADNFHNGYAIIKQNNRFGLIDKTGKLIVENIYDSLF